MGSRSLVDRRTVLVLTAVVTLGALLRAWGLWFGLPHALARPDETEAMGHALAILNGDLNPHFFHWPSLHLYVIAGIYSVALPLYGLAGLPADALTIGHYAIPARAYVALAGTLTVLALYRLAREVTGRAAAVTAALFLAVAPLHVRDSHFAMTDVTMTFFVTVSLWLVLAGSRRLDALPSRPSGSGTRAFALAGLAGGLAASTKYNAAVVLAAAACAQLWHLWTAGLRLRLSTLAPLVAFTACLAIAFLAATPFAILDYPRFKADLLFDFTHLSGGHGPDLGRGWVRHLSFSLPYGLGVPLFGAALAGLAAAARYKPRPVTILAAFLAVYYASVGSGYTVFVRYIMPLLPVLCLFAAIAVESLASTVFARTAWRRDLVLAVVAAAVMLPSLVASVWLVALLPRMDTRVRAAQWLTARLPAEATVHETGGPYVQLDIRSRGLHRWYFSPETDHFAGATHDMLPQWLVVHESPVPAYTPIPPAVARLARERYRLIRTFTATTPGSVPADYDQQDAFFLPLRNFGSVLRPGTNISVYARRGPPG